MPATDPMPALRRRLRGTPGPWGVPDPDERRALADGLGVMLRERRRAAGLTQRTLAERAGSHRGTVSKLERGERRPTPAMLASLAHALCPDDARSSGELYAALARAAGSSLTETTARGEERRARRERDAERLRTRAEEALVRLDAKVAERLDRLGGAERGVHTMKPLAAPPLLAAVRDRLGLAPDDAGRPDASRLPGFVMDASGAPQRLGLADDGERSLHTMEKGAPLPPRPTSLDTDAHHEWYMKAAQRAGVSRPPHPESRDFHMWYFHHGEAVERIERESLDGP